MQRIFQNMLSNWAIGTEFLDATVQKKTKRQQSVIAQDVNEFLKNEINYLFVY